MTSLAGPAGGEAAAARLQQVNHRVIDALIANDVTMLATVADPDFVFTDHGGEWLSLPELLARPRQPPGAEGRASEISDDVRWFGEVAVAHAIFGVAREDSLPLRSRATTVYEFHGGNWRLLSAQFTRLRCGVPESLQRGIAMAPEPWQGQDATGEELEVLRSLNERYVQAFRQADVAWYDAHLSPDYVVVFGDGSWHDRAAALADFARPHFADHIRSFPVDRVAVRRAGPLAIIRAENAYELKDGRRGINRYTDLWLKQRGRWLCIAAHITIHVVAA